MQGSMVSESCEHLTVNVFLIAHFMANISSPRKTEQNITLTLFETFCLVMFVSGFGRGRGRPILGKYRKCAPVYDHI